MAGALEAAKAEAVAHAAALAGAAEAGPDLVGALYEHVPPADVARRSPAELCAAALSLRRFAERRAPRQAAIRIADPDPAPGAPEPASSAPRTIIEIVNDDMPFLVDSVTAAITGGGRVVHLVIHPVLAVTRDAAGRLLAIGGDAANGNAANGDAGGGLRESWMRIEIGPEPDAGERARLAALIGGVLADVRVVVDDWQNMRQTLRTVLAEFAEAPPPLPASETAEVGAFLGWLDDDNFTFLGFRDYRFDDGEAPLLPALGILGDPAYPLFDGLRDLRALPPDVRDFVRQRALLVVTKTNPRATVHRTAHMDAIGLRRFDAAGAVVGLRVFVGLFTSLAYSRNPRSIPLLRLKVRRMVARAGLAPASHDGKALLHILDTFPRDELFQIDEDALFDAVIGILNLQERQRIALFVRRDPLERFVSCLVYVPRERYDTRLREAFAAILEAAFAGRVSTFYTHLDEDVLARIQFIVRTTRGAIPALDPAVIEARLAEAGQSWSDRLELAAAAFGEDTGAARLRRLRGFPIAYQARTSPAQALADLARLEAVLDGSPLEASLHPREEDAGPGNVRPGDIGSGLRLYRAAAPVVLSDVLPILENLGLRIIAEEPFRIEAVDGAAAWVHEFTLADGAVPGGLAAGLRRLFEEALVAVWVGTVENDGFNRLVLAAGLSARQIVVLRLYCKLLRQAGSAFSQAYMEDTLARHPEIARRLVRLFEIRFDPAGVGDRSLAAMAEVQAIDHGLDAVASLDEDRILRAYLTLILKTVRTNYYQTAPEGGPKPALAVKLASSEVELLPQPRPLYEIYVYSPRTEGVHLRAGRVARGGIRWSDRKEDFRTEILGLMKAQTVKNAVIVPVGSKGGFVLKHPPAGREAFQAEGIACYRILMQGLLDLTDNIVADADGRRRIVPPSALVRHDGDDPYLVVAADKGTATFSDIANAIAEEHGFWLGDAFASGGSKGFDHKEMGITSRGAWELVTRHFRELGRDIATSPFTVIGVGDMSGDVFGNGMLRSRQMRLLGAFNHLHVFVDPDPDPERSFAERRRLFDLPRSGWGDYDRGVISPGGGVFDRALKSIPISPEIKRAFAITSDHLTPAELIRTLLGAAVDLLWFGGIGTYVKAAGESQAEVGDRANDALRLDAEAIRATVVGEGANLGVTQRGRVAYALRGGRIDTDAIDNSAGVDTSDHEVNIKILVDGAIAHGALAPAEREPLLAGMVDDVGALVLRDNYLQGEALSVALAGDAAALDRQVRVMRALEQAGKLDRALEFLPDDAALATRAASRQGLVRPELAVLLAYAKMALYDELLASDLPDLPALHDDLVCYFPTVLGHRFAAQIGSHPLRREIIATVVTNDLVNRAGLTFVHDMRARAGRAAPEAARAYRVVRAVFELGPLWSAIEALDNRVAAAVQIEMLLDIRHLIEHAASWLLRANRLDLDAETRLLGPAAVSLAQALADLLPPADRARVEARAERLIAAGVPAPLAGHVAGTVFLAASLEIADLARRADVTLHRAAGIYWGVGARFALDEMRDAAQRLPAETPWQKLAVEATIDDVFALQADLALRVLTEPMEPAEPGADLLALWAARRAAPLAPAEALATELRAAATPDLAMLVVAVRQLRHALG